MDRTRSGLGLSGIVPQIFTAAGNLGVKNPAVTLSRIVGAGYLGILAGPAVIGWISHFTGLNLALILPLGVCVVGAAFAAQVAPTRRATGSEAGRSRQAESQPLSLGAE